ncbi:pyridoxamine 5'-phosphate oxidase family protein [Rothia nasimurium]|uniref:pyridoxamine 5'-phosphate oxidase family protein n=1 Tax=Rothia nasimurium TaxID=85336 RepID=UPI001F1CBBA1|nr:pyridoxamine 5'-phosphate oxidase family protein [Rothia nasimurium]
MVENPIKTLSEDRCWELLAAHEFGRLALAVGGEVDIYPVNFVVHEKKIYFRTAAGQKLSEVVISRKAAFEIDEVIDGTARSVVVHGNAHWLTSEADLDAVEALGLRTYSPTYKTNWVEVEPVSVSGREFEIGAEPADEL